MAQYMGAFRSNTFRVKDEEAFREFMETVQCEDDLHVWRTDDGAVGFAGYGDLPTLCGEDDEDGNAQELAPILATHLAEGEVCIMEGAGHEKLRYVNAVAVAVLWDGRTTSLTFSDLRDRVAKEFQVDMSKVTEAVY